MLLYVVVVVVVIIVVVIAVVVPFREVLTGAATATMGIQKHLLYQRSTDRIQPTGEIKCNIYSAGMMRP
jgi:hypothetical protein